MKKICLMMAVLLCMGAAMAQETEWKADWDEVVQLQPRTVEYLALRDGVWSLLDPDGAVVAAGYLDGFDGFENGLAFVRMQGKWGILNESGEMIVPPKFDYIGSFSDGLARVETGDLRGFIDETGAYVIEPIYYRANDFVGDYAAVAVKGESYSREEFSDSDVAYVPLWGVIDRTGRVIVPLEYDEVEIDLERNMVVAKLDGEETVFELPAKEAVPAKETAAPVLENGDAEPGA